MSQHKISLALGFLETQPQAAAEIIENQRAQDAADFMASIPPSKAALVVSEMLPEYAAQLCLKMPAEAVLSILSKVEAKVLVNIFRLLPASQRDQFLKELPAKTQVACTLMLNYSKAMVGAWMIPHVLSIPDQSSVGDALHRVETATLPVIGDSLFVVSRDRHLTGRVSLLDLLQATSEIPVNAISRKGDISYLHGRTLIYSAASSPLWEVEETVPVLNRRQEFIGVLRHADLRRAINTLREPSPLQQERPDLLSGISQGYGQTLLALVQSMQEFLQSELYTHSH